DVRSDASSPETLERILKASVTVAAGLAVGPDEKFVCVQVQCLGKGLSGILLGHQLRDAVNKDVFVVNGREAPDAGRNLDHHILVLVAQYPGISFGRERKDRMLHA